jgi:heme-binding NEAT domain protein
MVSTRKDILEKQYKEDIDELSKECKDGRAKVEALLGSDRFANTSGWIEVFKNKHNYSIADIQLMSVDVVSNKSPVTYFEQFMLRFQDNETVFIYIKLAEVK